MIGCFFARTPPPELALLLRALDTTDVGVLAELYGEARDRFKSADLMEAIDNRMAEVIATQATTPKGAP